MNTATAKVKITFSGTVGEAEDKAIGVVYDDESEKILSMVAERQGGTIEIPIAILGQGDLSKLHAYLVFAQPPAGTGGTGQVSGTAYFKVPAPPAP